ncbi:MAG: O-antigen ligase family protein [Chloroflexota bacterium]
MANRSRVGSRKSSHCRRQGTPRSLGSMKLTRLLIILALCVLLLVGGVATAIGASAQRAVALHGWTDPAQTANVPRQIPLAGVNVDLLQYDTDRLNHELDNIAAAGFVWVRQTFAWPDIEPVQGQFSFDKYDVMVNAVAVHPTLRLVAVLDNSPIWARRTDASDRLPAPPASMAAFGTFAAKLAARYADKIDTYQIWDEPNLNTQWGGLDPQPADYAAMLKAAYTAIHGNDSTATVIAAALAPTVETGPRNLSDVLYLRALYELGAADSFDAAAGKPYGFDSGPEDRTTNLTTLNFSHLILLRDEMVRHGDGQKPLWGSNFGWNHLPAGWTGRPSIWGQVDADTQRRYTRDSYLRAEHEWPWIGGLILEHWSPATAADDPLQGFAVANVAADWFESGAFFAHPVLTIGLHDPVDPRFKYEGDWRFGPLGADVQTQNKVADTTPESDDGSAHKLTFTFEGSELALLLRRADYVAYVYVRVDGQAANSLPRSANGDGYILLKSPDLETHIDLVSVAKNLAPGQHTAEVRFYLGYDRWALAGIAVGSPLDSRRYDLLILAGAIAAILGLVGTGITSHRVAPRLPTGILSLLVGYVRRMADILAGILVSGLAILGMLLTWNGVLPDIVRRDAPTFALTVITAGLVYFSPAFILTVLAIIVLWLLIYNRPVVGLALVIFWAPFFLAPVQLYIWALPMVELCLLLTLSAAIVRTLVNRQALASLSWRVLRGMDWAMLGLVVVASLSLLWSEQRAPALREWRIIVIEPALYYGLLRTTRLTKHELVRLVDVFLLAGALIAGMGLINYVIGGSGVTIAEQGARRLAGVYGSYASPNNLALFLGRCIPFAFAMVLLAPGKVRRVIAGIIVLMMGIAVVLTQSGGALLLGVPAAVICVLVLWNRRGRIMAGIIVVGMIALVPLSRFIPRLHNVLDLSRSSSFIRTQVWTSALNLLRERPLVGAGLDQFLYLYRSRYILPDAWREPDLSHPHNFLLDYWISLGVLGLAVLAALQFTFWRGALAAWRRWRSTDLLMAALAVGAMGSMADFLAHGLVDNSYFVVDLAYIFCFTLALVNRLNAVVEDSFAEA